MLQTCMYLEFGSELTGLGYVVYIGPQILRELQQPSHQYSLLSPLYRDLDIQHVHESRRKLELSVDIELVS